MGATKCKGKNQEHAGRPTGGQPGIGLAQVARDSGLSISMVSRVLGGKRTPSLGAAIRLAQALGITVDQLAGRLPGTQVALKGRRAA